MWRKITSAIRFPGLFLGGGLGRVVERHTLKYRECQELFFCPKTRLEEPIVVFCNMLIVEF